MFDVHTALKWEHSILEFLKEQVSQPWSSSTKDDRSIVTSFDLAVSAHVKHLLKDTRWNFHCEEDQLPTLTFPLAVLDPVDGTKEFAQQIPECSFSLAFLNNANPEHVDNHAMVANPFTGFNMTTWAAHSSPAKRGAGLLGLVSRSEWVKGQWKDTPQGDIILAPRGSIAFKLALLASGGCDFVVTRAPKNIWDIAAGTVLAARAGFTCYDASRKPIVLNQQLYGAGLLWCRPQDHELLAWSHQS